MVFNAIFNNISVILWRSVLLMEETGVPCDHDHGGPRSMMTHQPGKVVTDHYMLIFLYLQRSQDCICRWC